MSRPDLDALLNFLLPAAQEFLSKYGEFHPFAAKVGPDGSVVAFTGHTGEELPEAADLIALLLDGFRQQAGAGQVRAAGICINATVVRPGQPDKVDAICAQLEHQDGECVDVFLPYTNERPGEYKYGELFASAGEPRVFNRQP
jgi:hypothetical protein